MSAPNAFPLHFGKLEFPKTPFFSKTSFFFSTPKKGETWPIPTLRMAELYHSILLISERKKKKRLMTATLSYLIKQHKIEVIKRKNNCRREQNLSSNHSSY